jgi:RNA polymerase sigma-70 factor (ECF subfamily)
VESQPAALAMAEEPSETDGLARLLREAKAGDVYAFEQLLRLHERRVLNIAWRMLGDLEDAKDAAQQVFLRLYRFLPRFDERREFSHWLYRMTVNVCRDVARRRKRSEPLPEMAVDVDPDRELRAAEARRLVARALEILPARERAAVVLRDVEGLETEEVARILGSSPATVRSQVSSARLKIRKFIERMRLRKS